ncbi:Uncharacterised protein [Mycobacteroides abscessus subsp. abscessus]|nr:hypothetical protein DK45_4780 [Bordetella bronchiseptica]SHS05905.1 Uncharacterised protein [Mycobacteroides abscessus subsp. abscessus]
MGSETCGKGACPDGDRHPGIKTRQEPVPAGTATPSKDSAGACPRRDRLLCHRYLSLYISGDMPQYLLKMSRKALVSL